MTDRKNTGNTLPGSLDPAAVDRLKSELQGYALAQTERLLAALGRKLGESTVKLNDIAEGRSPGFARLALDGGRKLADGKGPVRTAVELGAARLRENVVDTVKSIASSGKKGRKGGGGRKPTVILESVDVGVPVREAYDQWTRYQDFPAFAKGVTSAAAADDTTSDWDLKVFWSNRSWKARTTEQIPDTRMAWTSEGAKGTTKGVVTFHALGDTLTRVLLVIEYYPKGLFEKTGNIWRAQGRRVRLDLKNFARHISMRGEAENGWRGEIADGEVVRTHEEAVAEEEAAEDGYEDDEYGYDTADDEVHGETEGEEPSDDEGFTTEDEHDQDEPDEDLPDDESAYAPEDEDDEAYETAYAGSPARDSR
ncbi:SRPBCC family protein [Streptomyces sp. NPDC006208]|uniref:SRPBCC family protein n=1 Tax=Streptomyces sp. NPDC006208 TaxID=3156734 RepID=UPI00339FB0B6